MITDLRETLINVFTNVELMFAFFQILLLLLLLLSKELLLFQVINKLKIVSKMVSSISPPKQISIYVLLRNTNIFSRKKHSEKYEQKINFLMFISENLIYEVTLNKIQNLISLTKTKTFIWYTLQHTSIFMMYVLSIL